jgi:hypothetical protein
MGIRQIAPFTRIGGKVEQLNLRGSCRRFAPVLALGHFGGVPVAIEDQFPVGRSQRAAHGCRIDQDLGVW